MLRYIDNNKNYKEKTCIYLGTYVQIEEILQILGSIPESRISARQVLNLYIKQLDRVFWLDGFGRHAEVIGRFSRLAKRRASKIDARHQSTTALLV